MYALSIAGSARPASGKSGAIVAALGILGLAAAGSVASMTLGAIGHALDAGWQRLTETEADIVADIADLETRLAARQRDLETARRDRDLVADALIELADMPETDHT